MRLLPPTVPVPQAGQVTDSVSFLTPALQGRGSFCEHPPWAPASSGPGQRGFSDITRTLLLLHSQPYSTSTRSHSSSPVLTDKNTSTFYFRLREVPSASFLEWCLNFISCWFRTSVSFLCNFLKSLGSGRRLLKSEGQETFFPETGGKMVNFNRDDSFSVNNGLRELTRGSNE